MSTTTLRFPAVVPQDSMTPRFPSVCYMLHKTVAQAADVSGTPDANLLVQDLLGNGPDLQLQVTGGGLSAVGTTWSANRGYATYSGSNAFVSPANNAYLASLFRLDTLTGQQLIMCYNHLYSGALASIEVAFMWGRTNGAGGGWYHGRNGSEQANYSHRPPGASGEAQTAFGGSAQQTTNQYVNVFSLTGLDANTALAEFLSYNLTTLVTTNTSFLLDLRADGTGPVSTAADATFKIGTREQGVNAFDRFNSVGGAAKQSFVSASRLSTPDSGLPIQCLMDMVTDPWSFPKSLRS